jgi:hypothetical protein
VSSSRGMHSGASKPREQSASRFSPATVAGAIVR